MSCDFLVIIFISPKLVMHQSEFCIIMSPVLYIFIAVSGNSQKCEYKCINQNKGDTVETDTTSINEKIDRQASINERIDMSSINKKDDGGIILIEQFGKPRAKQSGFDGERNLSIDCTELRYLRRYLLLVGQWYPKEWNSTKRALYHIWQVQNIKSIISNVLFKSRFVRVVEFETNLHTSCLIVNSIFN